MTAQQFCNHHGFEIDIIEGYSGRNRINIIDTNCRLFATGTRNGTMPIPGAILPEWIDKAYRELMDLILEKLYD